MRIAVVGLGGMGRTHLAGLLALGVDQPLEVSAVADVDDAAVDAHLAPGRRGWTTPLELVAEADVDAVVVAAPDAAHAELVHACLDRALPVLCEKPLTTSVAASAAVVEHELRTGRQLVQVGFMRRYDPAFAAVADAVHAGEVGPPAVVRTVHRNPVEAYAFEPSVLVRNSASHDVDLLRWVTGDEVVEVGVDEARDAGPGFAAFLLRTRTSGGTVTSTELVYGPGCGYVVGLEVTGLDGAVATPAERSPDWTRRFDDAYRRQLAGWVEGLRSGRPDPRGATAADGLAVSRVLDAADEAWTTGRTVRLEG
ncbi:Gfo/Idh/MocA family oxidoreductase [Angustibacter peucedani]